MDELIKDFNRLVIDKNFNNAIEEVNKLNVSLPNVSSQDSIDYSAYAYPEDGILVAPREIRKKIKLNPKEGFEFINKEALLSAYDESLFRFDSLEGIAYFFSHSLVVLGTEDYLPINYLTFKFYTRSKKVSNRLEHITYSDDPEKQSKLDCGNDRIAFLREYTPPNSILLIDGQIIAGDVYTTVIDAYRKFNDSNILPIFFVKNSNSNLVTDNIKELKDEFNSDLHWSFNLLNGGERTNFFQYTDRHNKNNTKVFCYLKAFKNLSPQRVEMHTDTYMKYEKIAQKIMDMIYYLILAQGDHTNPQVRPIAIAERYARTILKLVNVSKIIKKVGITPTMNQERFGW